MVGKITEMTSSAGVSGTDLIETVVDPGGTPLTRSATITQLLSYINTNATLTESQISDLGSYIESLLDDTSPQLGGSLDVNGNKIVSTSNADIDIEPHGTGNVLLGNFTLDADQSVGAGTDNYAFVYDNGDGEISLEALTTSHIISGTFADGRISESSVTQHEAALTVTESQISDLGSYITDVTGDNLSALADVTITSIASGEILKWNGSAWVNNTLAEAGIQADGALNDLVDDTTPQLGGDLDVNGSDIVSTANATISILPNGTGNVTLGTHTFDADQALGAGQDDYVMTYDNGTGLWSAEPTTGNLDNVVEDTTPQLGGMLDVNGQAIGDGTRELVTFTEDGSAVNHVNIENQATGSGPIISAAGDDTNVDLNLTGKGTGDVIIHDVQYSGAVTETVYTITDGAAFEVDPRNGTIQVITLTASRTPKATNFENGQSITMMIDDGTAYTITWTDATWGTGGVTWVGGTAPTLATTGYTVITFWKVAGEIYGSHTGDVA